MKRIVVLTDEVVKAQEVLRLLLEEAGLSEASFWIQNSDPYQMAAEIKRRLQEKPPVFTIQADTHDLPDWGRADCVSADWEVK